MTDRRPSVSTDPSRRRFLIRAATVLGGAIAAVLAVPVAGFMTAPGWGAKSAPRLLSTTVAPTLRSDDWASVGRVGDFEVGVPKYLEVERHVVDGWVTEDTPVGVHVVRTTDEDVFVFDPHCTHLGCPLSWSNGAAAFVCPCHGGMFGSTGAVLSGPAPRPMIRYETQIEDGEVFIGSFVAEGA